MFQLLLNGNHGGQAFKFWSWDKNMQSFEEDLTQEVDTQVQLMQNLKILNRDLLMTSKVKFKSVIKSLLFFRLHNIDKIL